MKALTFIEFDLPYCALNYGEGLCEAALGVTGDKKCFNTLATCQDRLHFDADDAGTPAVPAGAGAFVSSLVIKASGNTASVFNFDAVSIGAEPAPGSTRTIKIAVSGGTNLAARTLSGVTVNGDAAIIDIQNSATGVVAAITSRNVATGTTADIVVTFSGVVFGCAIGVYRIIDATTTPADTDTSSADPSSLSLNAPANSYVIAVGANRNRGTFTWTGVNERYDLDMDTTDNGSGASQTIIDADATFAITADSALSGNEQSVVAAVYKLQDFVPATPPSTLGTMVTYRFAIDTIGLVESGIEALPYLRSVQITPATVSLGRDLGTRGSVSATLEDRPHADTDVGFDKYYAERPYDPFKTGTMLAKLAARQPYVVGRPFRVIYGEVGQAIEDMETHHFVMESISGPDRDGGFTITAKDALKLADGDRAQVPIMSTGYLAAPIDADDTSMSLGPAGVGDIEYDGVEWIAIGGSEIVQATARTGDAFTIVRGQFNTAAVAHSADDRVQRCVYYQGESPADVIYDLLVTYAGVPSEYIPLDQWQEEVDENYRRLITGMIADPIAVKDGVSEIIEQCGLAIWWDDIARLIRLQVLRPIPSDAAIYDEEIAMERTLRVQSMPEERLSQVWVYFGQINPLEPVDDPSNYRRALPSVALQAETDYGQPAIRSIYSRWIPVGAETAASRLAAILLGRFSRVPRKTNLSLFRGPDLVAPSIGTGYRIAAKNIQLDTGEPAQIEAQITRLRPLADRFECEFDELSFVFFDTEDLTNRVITFGSNLTNLNLRQIHDEIYPAIEDGDTVTFVFNAIVGSTSPSQFVITAGDWPELAPRLVFNSTVSGCGGTGANGRGGLDNTTGFNGGAGGSALYTRTPIVITGNGTIQAGGGGGGGGGSDYDGAFGPQNNGGGGGGGAGFNGGSGGSGAGGGGGGNSEAGQPGTLNSGGAGGRGSSGGSLTAAKHAGGQGGAPGVAGGNANGYRPGSGGAPGLAVDGISYITEDDWTGAYIGGTVN